MAGTVPPFFYSLLQLGYHITESLERLCVKRWVTRNLFIEKYDSQKTKKYEKQKKNKKLNWNLIAKCSANIAEKINASNYWFVVSGYQCYTSLIIIK